MGQGRDLGLQLRHWLEPGGTGLIHSPARLANALCDGLGENQSLRGPVRDLGSRPLFLQLLHQQGAARASSLSALQQQLAQTYSPAVLGELLDLLEAACDVELERPSLPAAERSPEPPRPRQGRNLELGRRALALADELRQLAPGIAAAAAAAPVLAWLGQELDRAVFDPWGWSGGVVLAAVLGLLQALSWGPLRGWRRRWSLESEALGDPHQAWRWITAPWMHVNRGEASTNLLLLLVLLAATPLPLSQVVLRYCLTALAAQIAAALLARRHRVKRCWSGAGAPLMALVGLATGLSLLQGRALGFSLGPLSLPAWVLLLVVGALQLGWVLPRQDPQEHSTAPQRLLASTACWGLLLGLAWAVVSRLKDLL